MIRFVSEGGVGTGTKMLDAETGADLSKIVPIEFGAQITIGPIVTAACTIAMMEVDIAAGRTEFRTKHPVTGGYEPVASIAFRDGWTVEFADDGTPRVRQILKG